MTPDPDAIRPLNIILGICLAVVAVGWILAPWVFGEGF